MHVQQGEEEKSLMSIEEAVQAHLFLLRLPRESLLKRYSVGKDGFRVPILLRLVI